jgi:hypothetical protein
MYPDPPWVSSSSSILTATQIITICESLQTNSVKPCWFFYAPGLWSKNKIFKFLNSRVWPQRHMMTRDPKTHTWWQWSQKLNLPAAFFVGVLCGYGCKALRLGRGGGIKCPMPSLSHLRINFCAWLRICSTQQKNNKLHAHYLHQQQLISGETDEKASVQARSIYLKYNI